MANTLVKLFDDEVDLEEFILVDENDVQKLRDILDSYKKADPEYNIDGFFEELEANGIVFESLPAENIFF